MDRKKEIEVLESLQSGKGVTDSVSLHTPGGKESSLRRQGLQSKGGERGTDP